MKALFGLSLVILFSTPLYANSNRLNTNLNFTNRAQCALDSKKPTTSILVLLSNMDVGRSLYRLGKIRNERDISEFTKLGLNKYRYTVLSLIDIIHNKIITNKLPLLNSDLTLETNLVNYKNISEKCSQSTDCPELDDYLAGIWSESSKAKPNFTNQDRFTNENFLNVEMKSKTKKLNCSYLKKFTPLEAHLFGTKPTVDILEQIAKASSEVNDYYSECHDYKTQESLKVSTYEMSLDIEDSKRFSSLGFDYWNTMKIYFSWAFRNSSEATQLAYPFDEIFSSVLIEDSLFMVPNGCKSLVSPKCDPATINQNSVRLFAKHDFKQQVDALDFFRPIPDGAASKILEDQFTVVNQDILNFAQFETADAWTDNFRQNFSETRLTMRKKFVSSVNNMTLIGKNLKQGQLKASLAEYFDAIINSKNKALDNISLKSELYYLCAESTFLSSEELSYLRPKVENLGKLTFTDQATNSINSSTLNEIIDNYKEIATSVNELCGSFDQSVVFEPNFVVDRSGFNRWYIDTVFEGKIPSMASLNRKEKLTTKKPLIAYQLYSKSKDIKDIICIDSVDCARVAIQSIVDIYGVIIYSDLFLDIKREINSPSMLNPYAERTACKVYDPWFKTKASLFAFATDFTQGAISSVAPAVVYGNFDLQAGRVVSFNQLVKEGKIIVDPKYEKKKVLATVALDLGAMSNIPCSVSVTKSNKLDPSKILGFRGLTIRTCKEKEKNVVNVEVNNELGESQSKYTSGCLQCSLDFEHVTSAVSSVIPYGRTAFFMARAVIRLYKGLKDPVNVPRSWNVNPYLTKVAYDSHGGKIPNDCVRKLVNGKSCMKNSCEDSIVNTYRSNGYFLDSINSDDTWKGVASVKIKGCKNINKIKVSSSRDQDGNETCNLSSKNLNLKCETL